MKQVIYINSYANKKHHELFNTAVLIALNNFNIKLYSGKRSKNNMIFLSRENGFKLNFNNIKSTNLFILEGNSRWTNFFKYILGTLYNIYILLFSIKEKNNYLLPWRDGIIN